MFVPSSVVAHGETLIQIAATTRQIEASTTNNAAPLYLRRGELYREHQDWVSAEADYARAAQLDPTLAAVDFCRAGMLADAGQLEASRALYDKVIADSPRDGEALVGRARVLIKLNQSQAALADFRRGLELLSQPQPEYFLEAARAWMAAGQVDEALRSLDAGIGIFGPIVPLQGYAVDLEQGRNNTDAALARIDTILAVLTRKESWLARRGEVLLQAGRSREARKSFRSALAAMDTLPQRLRESPSMMELQTRVHLALGTIQTGRAETSNGD